MQMQRFAFSLTAIVCAAALLQAVIVSALSRHASSPLSSASSSSSSSPLSARLRGSRPNIVLVMADDMGWGDVGFNWPNSQDTPFLDHLAASSLIGSDHHSGASVCSPSRAALLTGRMAPRTGVWQNFPSVALGGLPANETVLGEYMKQAGYTTGMHGKWHLGTLPPFHPSYRGFDEYVGVPFSLDSGCTDNPGYDIPPLRVCPKDQQLPPLFEQRHERPEDVDLSIAIPLYQCLSPLCGGSDCNRDIIEQPVNLTTLSEHYIASDRRFIRESLARDAPFFLYIPLSHMHVPHATAPRFINSSAVPNVYGDTLRELDHHLNLTFHVLVEEGVVNDTLFIFTSPWSSKCELAGSPGPFAGIWQSMPRPDGGGGGGSAKFTTWEAGHRVPFLAHWPGKITPGRTKALTSNLDMVPTLVALANTSLPADRSFDGVDIGPVLFDGSSQAHLSLFHPDQNGLLKAMRYKQYKAYYQSYAAGDGACGGRTAPVLDHYPPLVFDLSVDIAESRPIDPVPAELVQLLDKLLADKLQDIESTPRSRPDYRSGGLDDRPCCDAGHIVCRCSQ